MERMMNLTKGDSPSGNGGRVILLTAAACGVTEMQQVIAAALQTQQILHSLKGNLHTNTNPWKCQRS